MMTLLEKKDYHKLTAPLKQAGINTLFARAVVEGCVPGSVYADRAVNPQTFYIVHPYGMSLLFGHPGNKEFNAQFKGHALNTFQTRNNHEWMQAFPGTWHDVLNELFTNCMIKSSDNATKKTAGIIELNTRVNFKFNVNRYRLYLQQKRPG
jgi:hypothetical protein